MIADVRALRREAGLSQLDLARILGVRRETVARAERGHGALAGAVRVLVRVAASDHAWELDRIVQEARECARGES